jgi:hypothetical protein
MKIDPDRKIKNHPLFDNHIVQKHIRFVLSEVALWIRKGV